MSEPVCRGSFALGTACGKCSRCREHLATMAHMTNPTPRQDLQQPPPVGFVRQADYDAIAMKLGCAEAQYETASMQRDATDHDLRKLTDEHIALTAERDALAAMAKTLTTRLQALIDWADLVLSHQENTGLQKAAGVMSGPIWDEARSAISAAGLKGDESAMTEAARDVLAERARQIRAEGWTPEHDDGHMTGELALAGASYAMASTFGHDNNALVLHVWPWDRSWMKATHSRRDLVKAGALILAEIERWDRAAAKEGAAS